jgi:hypothetical protein
MVAAFARFILEPRPRSFFSADADTARHMAQISRMIASSPALLARELEIFAGFTKQLAAFIAEDTHARAGDPQPYVVAYALIGAQKMLIDFTRRSLLDGTTDYAQLAREIKTRGRRALALLEDGFAGYGLKAAPRQVDGDKPR